MSKQAKLSRTAVYPLVDRIYFTAQQEKELRAKGLYPEKVAAQWDGHPARPPRKGEWFLSGAMIGAYRAGQDLTASYHIARLVTVETRTVLTTLPLEV